MNRCIEGSYAEFWLEKWVPSLGASWEKPMRAQFEAMFPHRCRSWPLRYLESHVPDSLDEWLAMWDCHCLQFGRSFVSECCDWTTDYITRSAATGSESYQALLKYVEQHSPNLCEGT